MVAGDLVAVGVPATEDQGAMEEEGLEVMEDL